MTDGPRLPIKIRKVSNEAFAIYFGEDKRASLHLYFLPDTNQDVAPHRLRRRDALALAEDVARTLSDAWEARNAKSPPPV